MTAQIDIERSALGAVLLDDRHLSVLTIDENLRPEHFAEPAHRLIFQAAIDLHNAGRGIDYLTVTAHLEDQGKLQQAGGPVAIEELTSWVPAAGNAGEYGRVVRQQHQGRRLVAAATQIQAEVTNRAAPIDEILEHASALIGGIADDGRHGRERHTWSPQELQSEYFDRFQANAFKAFPFSFRKLNQMTGGGLRPGQFMLVGGWSKMGKSCWLDAELEHFATQDLNAHLYINEQGRWERMDRSVARLSGVDFGRLYAHKLEGDDHRDVAEALNRINVGITECHGWTAEEIARDIRRNKWDVAGVDILHNIPHEEERGMTQIAHVMRTVSLQTKTALLATVHLNDARATGPAHPVPVVRDIRMSGMLPRLADIVMFVHRDEDEKGIMKDDGCISVPLVRDGQPGGLEVRFDPKRMRFAIPGVEAGFRAGRVDPDVRTQSQPAEFAGDRGASF